VFWFWFFVGPALALAIFSLRGERKRAQFVAERLEPNPQAALPPATVIVPIEGPKDRLSENLAALDSLDYPEYELILAARSASDIPGAVLPRRVTVVLGGAKGVTGSQKIQNMLAGVRASRKRSEVFAFADSGGRVSKAWLRALVQALWEPKAGAATGFYWYLPDPPDFWSLVRSVWHAPIAGLLGTDTRVLWPGSLAIRKAFFFDLQVPQLWQDAETGEAELSRALRNAGLQIIFAPAAMMAYAGRTGMCEFFGAARRQMIIARQNWPGLWRKALAEHFFYCGGMAAAVMASVRGSRGAEWALVAQLGLRMLKGVNHATLAKAELPVHEQWFKRHAWVHSLWVPLVTWIWLCVLVSSAFTKKISWLEKQYDLRPTSKGSH
jgi:hypothetical protein